ncbi:HdeD family acid-resistance protein [Roseibium sp.]|uniref:HdeD family acid-resistance protein n=1 Tax=Roseibium sp. TaxID=1936156 RepID=UPI003BA984B7
MAETATELATDFKQAIKEGKSNLMWVGIMMAVVGAIAIFFPFAATITANYMVGFLFLFSGALGVWHSFSIKGTGPFFGALLMGLITVVAGVFLLANPLEGVLILTLTVGIVFIFEGAYQIFAAFELRPTRGWGWMLVSAIISIAAGLLIVSKLPGTSLFVLGLIMGINFLSTGISMIMLSKAVEDAE